MNQTFQTEQPFEGVKTDAPDPIYNVIVEHGENALAGYTELNPAPGSANLEQRRDWNGQGGAKLGVLYFGDNTGEDRQWPGINTFIPQSVSNPNGDVTGGQDVGTQQYLAYEASLIQQLTQQQSAAAFYG